MVVKVYVNRTRIREARTTSTGTKPVLHIPQAPRYTRYDWAPIHKDGVQGTGLEKGIVDAPKNWTQLRLNLSDQIVSPGEAEDCGVHSEICTSI